MPLKFFRVSARDGGGESDLNSFLNQHRILQIDREWVDLGENSYWAFCIEFLPLGMSKTAGSVKGKGNSPVDYREILNPEDFTLYAKLRDLRKTWASSEAVPPYLIFTNDQLAKIVENKVATKADLAKIDGLGDARIEKYGDRLLEYLKRVESRPNEASGPTV
ncbi:MAG: HRDC domain-containing protein [Schlesneria sp.]